MQIRLDITKDTAGPALTKLASLLASQALRRYIGGAVTVYTQAHLRGLTGNKNGWPSQQFYQKAALGTRYETVAEGVRVLVDNEDAPGAMKHQFNRGIPGRTEIVCKGKLLTVPARAEFYGHSPREFDNLKFVSFASGAKALVIGSGGTNLVNFGTGRGSSKGTGARSAMMIAYWLVDRVEQDAKPEVLPSKNQYLQIIGSAVQDGLRKLGGLN